MAVQDPSELVDFDADAARAVVEATVSGTLRSMVESDSEGINALFVDDSTLASYGDEARMDARFAKLHSSLHLDLAEAELFTGDLFPIAEAVEYIATALDLFKLVRIYHGEAGLFVALDHDEPVEPVVGAVRDVIENGAGE